MTQSTTYNDSLAALKTSIQGMVQAIIDAQATAGTAENALLLDGHSYQDILDAVTGGVSLTIQQVQTDLNAHKSNAGNPHGTTKTHVGLGLVENLALALLGDLQAADKAAIQADNGAYVTPQTAYYLAQRAASELVGAAPEALDTIEELAAALQGNENVITEIMTALGNKVDTTTFNTTIADLSASDVGLENLSNFPIATLTQGRDPLNTDFYVNPPVLHGVVEDAVVRLMDELTTEFDAAAPLINPPPSP